MRGHHDAPVRTTLTLDDDVARELRTRARVSGRTIEEVVNEAIRAGLRADKRPADALPPFRVTPRAAGFRSGVDVLHLNQLGDELDIEHHAELFSNDADFGRFPGL